MPDSGTASQHAIDGTGRRAVVVALTPNALRSDTRTLKQAASLARAGYRSIVVERFPSGRSYDEYGIELVTLSGAEPQGMGASQTPRAMPPSGTFIRRQVRRLARGPLRPLRDLWVFLRFLRQYSREEFWPTLRRLPAADLYILHSFHYWPVVRAKRLLSGRRYLYDAHDFYRGIQRREDLDRWTAAWMLPFWAWLDRRAARHAARVTTVSEGCADLYERSDGVRPLVIRNVHERRFDRPPAQTLRAALSLDADQFIVVVVGNWKPGMAIASLVGALAALPRQIHVAFVGKGYEKAENELAGDRSASRVHFVPARPSDQVVPFIGDADAAAVLYVPYADNYAAALPNGFFQSIGAGLPLLYPPLREIRRLAEAFGFGIEIDPQSAESLASAIRRLYEQPQLRAELRARADKAMAELSWQAEEGLFLSVVDSLIER